MTNKELAAHFVALARAMPEAQAWAEIERRICAILGELDRATGFHGKLADERDELLRAVTACENRLSHARERRERGE